MNQREAVERFHLVFLRHFATVISPGTICLKGGVNLRLYHNSPRLSEDLDFDARVVGVEILKKNVNQVVPFLPADLAAHYDTPRAWKAMAEKVRNDLSAALQPSSS